MEEISTAYNIYIDKIIFWNDMERSIASTLVMGPTQPPMQWVLDAFSPGVKHLVCEADQSPPSSVKVNKCGAIPPLPHIPL
jgi:hypothetical protein